MDNPINPDAELTEITNQDVRDMIVGLRGGVPKLCDYCGNARPESELHPDEGDTWICNECIKRIGY